MEQIQFSKEELERYSRHLIIPEFNIEGQRKLKGSRVLVIGSGGLGSPLLLYLAAAGVGRIGIVDFDTVDASNLQRQVLFGIQSVGAPKAEAARDRLASLNPHITLEVHNIKFTSANARDLIDPARFDVFQAQRGGQYTYHGPGQRVIYVLLDVGKRGRDVRKFVQQLEDWVIQTLAEFNITGEIRPGRVGVWVTRPDKPLLPGGALAEDKIAAIGIRLRKWVSFHGISINVEPDLEHFSGIVPCGIAKHGVTSLVDLGLPVTLADVDLALRRSFDAIFSQQAAP